MSLRVPLLPEPIRWCPAGVVAGLIWYWSLVTIPPTGLPLEMAITAGDSAATASGFGAPLESMARSATGHAVAYATLALCLVYGLADREISLTRKVFLVFVLTTGYGAAMEVGQLFQPERIASLADVVVNALGATAALSWYGLERRVTFVPVGEFRRESRKAT